MVVAVARGEAGRDAIRATRITRQTIRGKEGGVYYVLAPGPSLLLAPALRADRALNLAQGTKGRIAASVLLWCILAALLVAAVFALLRDATGRPGLAAALALGFALVPPFLFYFFQFYPEMPGALVLAVACAMLVRRPDDEHEPGNRSARAPAAAPVAVRWADRDPALAAPEVPAGVGRARGDGVRARLLAARTCRASRPRSPGDRRPAGADALPDRALQLRDHRQRAARRALPRLGPRQA